MYRLSLVTLFVIAAAAQTPTIDQSLGMQSVGNARISPDGRYVAYTVTQTNWEENEFAQQIWIAVVASGERYQLTSGKKSSQNPKWSPDSTRVAFLSERDGKRQIYVIRPHGGEAQQLSSEENGVDSMEWAPDGSAIAYSSIGPDAKAKKDRKEKYGEFDVIGGDYSMVRLWLEKTPAEIPADAKQRPQAEALTEGDNFSVGDFAWSPDSRHIAFSATRDPDLSSSDTAQIYTVDVTDKLVKKLLDSKGPNTRPRWSPDGTQIAFVTGNGEKFFFYMNTHIAVIPAAGGEPRIIDSKFDEDASLIDWGPDGIYFAAFLKSNAHVFRVNPENLAIDRISSPDSFFVPDASFTPDHRMFAAVGAAPNHCSEVFVSAAKDFAPKYLTNMSEQWKEFRLTTREVIEWNRRMARPSKAFW